MIALVSCSSLKLPNPAPAKELYCSPLFRKARAYAERHAERWYILSALHGLVDPEVIIEPYNHTLIGMTRRERILWSLRVANQLGPDISMRLTIFAGRLYVDPLLDLGLNISQPLKGLGIGQQLHWFTEQESPCHLSP